MLNDAGGNQMRAVDDHMCRLSIQRIAQRMQFFQPGQRIFHLKQRAIAIMAGTLIEQPGRHIQINHPTRFMQSLTVLWIDDNASPGSQNQIGASRQFMDGLSLTPTKAIFALDFEYRRNRHPGSLDDFVVGIQKQAPQPLGQHTPDSRLAGPHQADQINIAMLFHGWILAESTPLTKKAGSYAGLCSMEAIRINQYASCRK